MLFVQTPLSTNLGHFRLGLERHRKLCNLMQFEQSLKVIFGLHFIINMVESFD